MSDNEFVKRQSSGDAGPIAPAAPEAEPSVGWQAVQPMRERLREVIGYLTELSLPHVLALVYPDAEDPDAELATDLVFTLAESERTTALSAPPASPAARPALPRETDQ